MTDQKKIESWLFRLVLLPAMSITCLMGAYKTQLGWHVDRVNADRYRIRSQVIINYRKIKIDNPGIYMNNKRPDNSFLNWRI